MAVFDKYRNQRYEQKPSDDEVVRTEWGWKRRQKGGLQMHVKTTTRERQKAAGTRGWADGRERNREDIGG